MRRRKMKQKICELEKRLRQLEYSWESWRPTRIGQNTESIKMLRGDIRALSSRAAATAEALTREQHNIELIVKAANHSHADLTSRHKRNEGVLYRAVARIEELEEGTPEGRPIDRALAWAESQDPTWHTDREQLVNALRCYVDVTRG